MYFLGRLFPGFLYKSEKKVDLKIWHLRKSLEVKCTNNAQKFFPDYSNSYGVDSLG